MKASLKFREDQKPLFRAKVPINVLGLPFQSGVVAGESKELTLSLASFFDSGPSLKLAYRPNDSWNPFSLIVKTGSGPFGSPNSSSMMMTAEFNMLGRGNPSFFLHFKPRFGDFCIKKSQSSAFVNHILKSEPNGVVSDEEDGTVEVVEKSEGYFPVNGVFSGNKIGVSPPEGVSAAGVINGLFSGVDLSANTVLPMRKGAVLSFRWGLRVPAEVKTALTENGAKNSTSAISFRKIPFLVMNKIGIEHVDSGDSKEDAKPSPPSNLTGNADMVETSMMVKRHLEVLQAENGLLKKSIDDLRSEFATSPFTPHRPIDSGKYRESDRTGSKPYAGKTDRRSSSGDKKGQSNEGDFIHLNDELKKPTGIGA
ncbi:hypothetical protein AAG906_036100 [Vitis piasezkii]